jgi:hypothetical protein
MKREAALASSVAGIARVNEAAAFSMQGATR